MYIYMVCNVYTFSYVTIVCVCLFVCKLVVFTCIAVFFPFSCVFLKYDYYKINNYIIKRGLGC